jgi:Sec-independent protein translocase protein TatA
MFFGEIFGVDGFIVIIVVAVLIFGGSSIPKLRETWAQPSPSSKRVSRASRFQRKDWRRAAK